MYQKNLLKTPLFGGDEKMVSNKVKTRGDIKLKLDEMLPSRRGNTKSALIPTPSAP